MTDKSATKLNLASNKKSMDGIASTSSMAKIPQVIVSIIDPKDHVRRENWLKAKELRASGSRGQPPMTQRLRMTAYLVDHLERQGVQFATAPNSRMNKAVRKWLNERMAKTTDDRKSRRKIVTADTVKVLLKQVAELRN